MHSCPTATNSLTSILIQFSLQMITQFVINFAPLGVCFLVAEQVLVMKSFEETFKGLGAYFGTVVLGLLIHGLIILPILYGDALT